MKKKAQINQAFIYLAAILVIGAIIILGVKGWNAIFKTNCEDKKVDFQKQLMTSIDEYSDYGAVQEKTIFTSCGAKEVCFVDYGKHEEIGANPDIINNTVILSNIGDGTANIFVKGEFTESIGLSNKVSVAGDGVLCIKVRDGKIKILFSGTGKTVNIEQAS
jgi:hypothetical protein